MFHVSIRLNGVILDHQNHPSGNGVTGVLSEQDGNTLTIDVFRGFVLEGTCNDTILGMLGHCRGEIDGHFYRGCGR